MRLIKTELWERLIFDEDCTDVFKTTDGKFVTANINLHVCDEAEVSRLYNEFNSGGFTVLKEGTPPSKHIWIGICNACESKVIAKYSHLCRIDWSLGGEGYATCPICQQTEIKFTRVKRYE